MTQMACNGKQSRIVATRQKFLNRKLILFLLVFFCAVLVLPTSRQALSAQGQFRQKRDELADKLKERKAILEEIKAERENDFQSVEKEISAYLEMAEEANELAEKEKAEAESKLKVFDENVDERLEREQERIAEARENINKTSRQLQDLLDEKRELDRKMKSLRASKAEKTIEKMEAVSKEVREYEVKLAQEEAKLSETKEGLQRVSDARDTLKEVYKNNHSENGKKAIQEVEQAEKEAEKNIRSLKSEINDTERKLRSLRRELDSLKRKGAEEKMEKLRAVEARMEELNDKITCAEKEKDAVLKRVEVLEGNLEWIKNSYRDRRVRRKEQLLESSKLLEEEVMAYHSKVAVMQKKLDLDKQEFESVVNDMLGEIKKVEDKLAPPVSAKGVFQGVDIGAPGESGTEGRPLRRQRPEYYLSVGDVLYVMVWRIPDLSLTVEVGPDGRLSYPLLGELYVEGMTLVELDEIITEGLREYVTNPQVSIMVKKFGGRKFVVLGEVRMPGVYRYVENVTILEAIALAGGFQKYAAQYNIALVRGDITKSPKVRVISVDANAILYQGAVSENVLIQKGDIIYVTRGLIGHINDFLEDTIQPAMTNLVDFFVVRSAWRWQFSGMKRN